MITMTLQQAAQETAGVVSGNELSKQLQFNAIATDTRKPMPKSLFIALKGENFNGHEYIDKAVEQGAIACMLDEDKQSSIPVLKVENTVFAMGQLALSVRKKLHLPCIGITGSSGKTTVKDMVASILSVQSQVLSTRGNFNNAIGVPLTLFRLSSEDQYAVIEMGASKVGDINEIAQLVLPEVAVITNISAAHLQGLGSLDGIAKVKGEILEHLQKGGIAVLEQDSPWLEKWTEKLTETQKVQTFALENTNADFYSSELKLNENGQANFKAHTPVGDIKIQLPLPGKHNICNALAAMAAAVAVGASLSDCQIGLANVSSGTGRLQLVSGFAGSRLIDDSYNANPASLSAAMQFLKSLPGNKIVVLGDMAELGDLAVQAHIEAGQMAKKLGFEGIYATGSLTRHTVNAFGDGAHHFPTKDELATALKVKISEEKSDQWNLLIKGSRSSAMEQVVKILQQTGIKSCS